MVAMFQEEDDSNRKVENIKDLMAHSRLVQFSPHHLTNSDAAQEEGGSSPDGVGDTPKSPATHQRRLSKNISEGATAKSEERRLCLNRPLSFEQVNKVVEMLNPPKTEPTAEKDKKKPKKQKKHQHSAKAANGQEDSLDLSPALLSLYDDTLPSLKSEDIKPEAILSPNRSVNPRIETCKSFDDDTPPSLKSEDVKPEAIPSPTSSVDPRIETCKKRPSRKCDAPIFSPHASSESLDPRIFSSLRSPARKETEAGKQRGSDESLLTGSSGERSIPISPITPPEEVLKKKAFVGVSSVKEAPSLRNFPMPGLDGLDLQFGSPAERFKLQQKLGHRVSKSASTYTDMSHPSGLSIDYENLSKYVDPGTPDASPTSPWVKMKYDIEKASFQLPSMPKKLQAFDSPPNWESSTTSLTVDDLVQAASTTESIGNSSETGTAASENDDNDDNDNNDDDSYQYDDDGDDDDDDDSIRYEDNMAAYIEIDSIREILKSEMGALFQDILPSIVDHRPESERNYLKETLKIDMRQLLDQVFANRRTTHAAFDEEEADTKPPAATRKAAPETPRRQKNSGLDKSSA
jgi:hypothetical protein